MATSPIVTATLQSASLAALSNILAQAITAYKTDEPLSIDWVPVFQYVIFAMVSTPPNFMWQDFLESAFPAHPRPSPRHSKKSDDNDDDDTDNAVAPLSIRNTICKLVLDQTLSAAINTLLYSTFTRALRSAMFAAPRITNAIAAAKYWTSPRAIDFTVVDFGTVWQESKEEFWPLMIAGLKLWPAVSLVNFSLIKSVQGRNLVGAMAGVVWGVYVCLLAGN